MKKTAYCEWTTTNRRLSVRPSA